MIIDGARSPSGSPEPAHAFSLAKEGDEGDAQAKAQAAIDVDIERERVRKGEQISAADYDPHADRKEEEQRRLQAVAGKNGLPTPEEDVEMNDANGVVEEGGDAPGGEASEDEEDDEDLDDMFAVVTAPKKKSSKVKVVAQTIYLERGLTGSYAQKPKVAAPALVTTTLDAAADAEGYYQVILGEQLDNGRYQVFSSLGKGMFSNVVRARVLKTEDGEPTSGKEVAIKIVRAQETM